VPGDDVSAIGQIRRVFTLRHDDLLRDAAYRRLFLSILVSGIGGQVSLLALPLTAATLLSATPTQMGILTACETAPFAVLALPTGVWLDRVRKLPVYVAGELALALALLSVTVAHMTGVLAMTWLYVVAFMIGTVQVVSGSAAQIVLTQVVPRERLVDAHAKNSLASAGADVAGPGLAGALIKAVGAPAALVVNAVLLFASVAVLRTLPIKESLPPRSTAGFVQELLQGLRFVRRTPLLVEMAFVVGAWHVLHNAALVVQILFATRTLGLQAQDVGLSYIGLGVGTVFASVVGRRLSARIGPGPSMLLGVFMTSLAWLLGAIAEPGLLGVALFTMMLGCFGFGAVILFINFLSMRQAKTPAPLLGRMTLTMRWLIVLPAGPGALLGGFLGDTFGLRASLAFAGIGGLVVTLVAVLLTRIRQVRHLPTPDDDALTVGAEAAVTPMLP
jgi:MFS family permease